MLYLFSVSRSRRALATFAATLALVLPLSAEAQDRAHISRCRDDGGVDQGGPDCRDTPLPPVEEDTCNSSLINQVLSQCGNSSNPDPRQWYSITNHCNTKAHDVFRACESQGFEARYISLSCKGSQVGHNVTTCKVSGQWLVFNIASVEDVGGPYRSPRLPQKEICRMMARPEGCDCQAKVLPEPPKEGPETDPNFCANEAREKLKKKASQAECLKCCQEFKEIEVDQAELREFSCRNFKRECVDNLQTGLPSEMLYWGLIAAWRCDQWPKAALVKFNQCERACQKAFPEKPAAPKPIRRKR